MSRVQARQHGPSPLPGSTYRRRQRQEKHGKEDRKTPQAQIEPAMRRAALAKHHAVGVAYACASALSGCPSRKAARMFPWPARAHVDPALGPPWAASSRKMAVGVAGPAQIGKLGCRPRRLRCPQGARAASLGYARLNSRCQGQHHYAISAAAALPPTSGNASSAYTGAVKLIMRALLHQRDFCRHSPPFVSKSTFRA